MDFYRRMAVVCRAIPEGKVASYGQVALLCGKPGNARQVGYGLKMGLGGENLPAHRIVNGKGILRGSAYFETPDMQSFLLKAEGIEVRENNGCRSVDMKVYRWKNTMQEAEGFLESFQTEGI